MKYIIDENDLKWYLMENISVSRLDYHVDRFFEDKPQVKEIIEDKSLEDRIDKLETELKSLRAYVNMKIRGVMLFID